MKNVLIVDDEKSLLFSIKAGFEPFGSKINLVTASNGLKAIQIMDSMPVDIVVTDLKMPEMDGFDVLAHLSMHYPDTPAMVMTAFNTPEIENRLNKGRSIPIFEKPVDFNELVNAIIKTLNNGNSKRFSGISLAGFMQLIHSERKSCLLEARANGKIGYIYFKKGELLNAIFEGIKGEEAVFRLLEFNEVQIGLKKIPPKKIKQGITKNLMQILLEGMRRKDETNNREASVTEGFVKQNTIEEISKKREQIDDNSEPINTKPKEEGVYNMTEIKESLEKFKVVEGFMAVGAFTPSGEVVADVNTSGVNLGELGALANDVLLKAQKATEVMGVGRGRVVHIEAPKAHIFARCLNESTDFAATTAGRAHVHMVLVLDKEGSIGMAKMRMESVIQEIAVHFR